MKAHTKLNKREQKLLDSLDGVTGWKTINVPIVSMGTIMTVALQYRQAIGQTTTRYRFEWAPDDVEYLEDATFKEDKANPVLFTQNGHMVCEVAEAFGRRLLKMAVL